MGVYYNCTQCTRTLHLTPQSPGFGQLRIKCFLCGGEAMYAPSGPPKDVEIVNAPAGGGTFEDAATNVGQKPRIGGIDLRGIVGGTDDEGPSPTVPLQTPLALLQMDADEAAPTIPVSGLSDEQIAAVMSKGRGLKDSIDPTTPMKSPIEMLNAAFITSQGPRKKRLDDEVSTLRQPGLAEEIIQRATPPPARPVVPEDAFTTNAYDKPTPAPAPSVEPPTQAFTKGPDEDKIPTRSVEGLSNREITYFARDLYEEEPDLDEPQSPEDPSLDATPQPTPAPQIVTPEGPLPSLGELEGVKLRHAPALNPNNKDEREPAWSQEPQLSPSMFTRSPLVDTGPGAPSPEPAAASSPIAGRSSRLRNEPSFTGISPAVSARDEPSFGDPQEQTTHDSFAGEAPPGSSPNTRRRTGAGLALVGLVFVIVFFSILGGLFFFFQSQEDDAPEDPPVAEVPAGEDSKPSRTELFGFDAVDPKAPFEVRDTRIRLTPDKSGKKTALELTGKFKNTGESALDSANLAATLAMGEGEVHKLAGGVLDPTVSRKKPWEPGKIRAFTFKTKGLSLEALGDRDKDPFIWIVVEASNGKSFEYKGTVVELDVKP